MNTIAIDAKSLLLSADLERDDILEAIDRLPEHHKSVFNMYVIDRFSHSEIGKILHISTGTSKSHLSRARKAIQLFLLERIKEKPVDEKKKRRIAFLIFLGFGNQMFANFCKKQFKDFEIEPLETFESVTNKGTFPSQFIGLAKINPVPKFMTIAICFLGVLGVAFYAYFFDVKDIPQKHPKPDLESVDIIPENQLPVAVEDTAKGEEPATEPKSIKTLFTHEKATVTNKNSQKTIEEVNSIVTKDSVKNEPQKVVIIKRQIVKKIPFMFQNKILLFFLAFTTYTFSQEKKIDTIYVYEEIIIHDTVFIEKPLKIDKAIFTETDKKDLLELTQNGKKITVDTLIINSKKGLKKTKKLVFWRPITSRFSQQQPVQGS
ncbi:RNA polymerase sigma factor [Flavobacterium lindanitolerans]|nr:RNA polymerase sigma factor [Flavobacterium lindanitolerans]